MNLRAGTLPPPTLSAGLGEANTIGSFVRAADVGRRHPGGTPISYTLPTLPETGAGATAAPAAEAGSGSTLSEMALAGMAGRAMAGTVGTGGGRGAGKSG